MNFQHKSNEVKYFTLKERVEKIEKEQRIQNYTNDQKYADDERIRIYKELMTDIVTQDKNGKMFQRDFPPINIIEV